MIDPIIEALKTLETMETLTRGLSVIVGTLIFSYFAFKLISYPLREPKGHIDRFIGWVLK